MVAWTLQNDRQTFSGQWTMFSGSFNLDGFGEYTDGVERQGYVDINVLNPNQINTPPTPPGEQAPITCSTFLKIIEFATPIEIDGGRPVASIYKEFVTLNSTKTILRIEFTFRLRYVTTVWGGYFAAVD